MSEAPKIAFAISSLAIGATLLACAGDRPPDATNANATTTQSTASSGSTTVSNGDVAETPSAPSAGDAGSKMDVPNAIGVIDALRPHLRNCYNRGLQIDHDLRGSVTFTLQIDATGAVESTSLMSIDGLTAEVTSCLEGVLKGAKFDAPPSGHGTINVPVRFVNGKPKDTKI